MKPEMLRKWIRQAQVDQGSREAVTSAAAQQIRELKRKNVELGKTVAILKEVTALFVREADPRHW